MTNSIKIPKVFYVVRDGRDYFFKDVLPDWVDEDYHVTELVRRPDEFVGPVQAVETDSHKELEEHLKLMDEIYTLEEAQIASLKEQIAEFVEVVEAIVEIAVPTDHLIENKAKLLLVNEECRQLLKARE